MKYSTLLTLSILLLVSQANLYSQWSDDPKVNNTILELVSLQKYDVSVKDYSGSYISVNIKQSHPYYEDTICAYRFNTAGKLLWGPKVVKNPQIHKNPFDIRITTDGSGGAIIVWKESQFNNYISGYNILAQRIDSLGSQLWGPDGVIICDAPGYKQIFNGYSHVISDGEGGAIIVWTDLRNGIYNRDIYGQRINSSGKTLWQNNGLPISIAPDEQMFPDLYLDKTGYVFVVWSDRRNYNLVTRTGDAIYAQKISLPGQVQWDVNGIPVCTKSGGAPKIIGAGSQEVIVVWAGGSIKAQKINTDGVIQWDSTGVDIFKSPGLEVELKDLLPILIKSRVISLQSFGIK